MDAEERERAMAALDMSPESEIGSGEEYRFGGAVDGDQDDGPDALGQLVRDWLEPESRSGKSRISDRQAIAIPVLREIVAYRPEYSDGLEDLIGAVLDGHLEATPAIDGEAREQAVEILRSAYGRGGAGPADDQGPGLVMRMAGAEEDDDA